MYSACADVSSIYTCPVALLTRESLMSRSETAVDVRQQLAVTVSSADDSCLTASAALTTRNVRCTHAGCGCVY